MSEDIKLKFNPDFQRLLKEKLKNVTDDKTIGKGVKAIAERLRTEVSNNLPFDTKTARRSTRVIKIDEKNYLTNIGVDYASFIHFMGDEGRNPTQTGTEPKILEIAAKQKKENAQVFVEAIKDE